MNKKTNNTYQFHIAMIILIAFIYIIHIYYLWNRGYPLERHLLIALFYIIGTAITFNRVYNILGWFLSGMGYVLISLELPSLSFKSDPILFLINIAIFAAFSIFYITLLYRRTAEQELIIKTELKQNDDLQKKGNQIIELKKSLDEKSTQIQDLRREGDKREVEKWQYSNSINELNGYITTFNTKFYESQLSTLFQFTIIDKHNEFNETGNFGLHSFQGNLDSILADFIGETNDSYWLVELKREKKDIVEEKKKTVRLRQLNELEKSNNELYKKIAGKCHWVGWGENLDIDKERTILFSIYWDTVIKGEYGVPIGLYEFALRAFSQDDPVGVGKSDFSVYLNFLLENSGKDTTSVGDRPIFIFVKDNHGRLKNYAATTISYFFEKQRDLTLQKEIQIKRERERGQSWEYDLSL